jgi:hypothetical protein
MPLSIDQYTNWAAFNANTEVALKKDSAAPGLEQASNQVGTLARFFGTKSAKSVRTDVMADFTRALSMKYGASLAEEALSSAGLTPTSKLDGKTIASVVNYARTHGSQAVDSLMRQDDIKLMSGSVSRAQIDTYSSKVTRNYLETRRLVLDLLGETPVDDTSLADFKQRCDDLTRRLFPTANPRIPHTDPAAIKLQQDATALTQAIMNKKAEVEAMTSGQPLSTGNVHTFKAVWAAGALRALSMIKEDFPFEVQDAINKVGETILPEDDPNTHFNSFVDTLPLEKDMHKPLAKILMAKIAEQLPAGTSIPLKEDVLAKHIFSGYRDVLNRGSWDVISKPITVSVGGAPMTLTSKIVPGVHIGAQSDDATGPIGETYETDVKGYMCHSAHTDHAVNLAVSSISVPDKTTGQPKLAFQGIRHGVHCAWEISDPKERAAANVKRAEEAVIAAFLADPANAQKVRNGETLNMTSVSLLTPDVARHIKPGRSSDERLMLREQKAAWDAVSKNGVTFTHNGETFHIKPRVFTLNFGVNAGAVKFGSIAPNLAGGWGMSDDMNYQAVYKQMKPLVQQFVNDPNIPSDKRKTVMKLFNQCMGVMSRFGEHSDSHDAYKVAARLAVMTHLMGWTPCWNCKSGKDRTGQLDVECKFLATLIARGEDIPEPGAKLTTGQRNLFRAVAFEGGNFEMQKLNTGIGGFKTSGVASIIERLGGKIFRNFHKGGSEFVNV